MTNRPCRILVVDDNSDAADMLALLLEGLGHTTHVAHDATEALAAIDQLTPELAVLDIGLPGMDGYELARRLRANPITRNTCLIALSGYGQDSDKEQSAKAGFDAHLVKPIAFTDLRTVIEQLTRGVTAKADDPLPVN